VTDSEVHKILNNELKRMIRIISEIKEAMYKHLNVFKENANEQLNEFKENTVDQGSSYQTTNSKVDTGKSRKHSGVSRYR
jgi:DNA-directed RNA polymerase subunit F